jgi:hypothetical protein
MEDQGWRHAGPDVEACHGLKQNRAEQSRAEHPVRLWRPIRGSGQLVGGRALLGKSRG